MFYGLLNLNWWQYVIVTFILSHITLIAVTIFLHRCQSHRALTLHPIISHFFRAWLWLTTGMETKAWVAIHRKHHAKTETIEDPHSPIVLGLKTVLWQGAELYRREAKNIETLQRYGTGTPNDWLEKNIYTKHSAKGIIITLLLNILLMGIPGIIIWSIQMSTVPFLAAGIINGVAHFWGYRNFECPDAATNIIPIACLIVGEELHNNHHTYPTSAKFSVKTWEFDLGWLYIKTLSFLKLAKVKRVPPKVSTLPNKQHIDVDTLKAIIFNRIEILSYYTKSVIIPIFKQEKKLQAKNELAFWKLVKSTIVRNDKLLDNNKKEHLEIFLAKNEALKQVYQLRVNLQNIWEQTTASQKELVEALQDWCKQAEETGVQTLQEFAAYLRGYRLVH